VFVQGYIATLTVNSTDVEIYSSDASLTLTADTLDKTTLGVVNRQYIPGLQDGSLSISMHLDTTGVSAIQGSFGSTTPVPFVFRPGKVGGPDAGQWVGTMIITDFEIGGSVDDNWQMNINGQVTGAVTYTQPA